MPKKVRKRLVQRKGTNIRGRSTKTEPKLTNDRSENAVSETSTATIISPPRIIILQDICIVPAKKQKLDKPSLNKGKTRISFVSTKEKETSSEDEDTESVIYRDYSTVNSDKIISNTLLGTLYPCDKDLREAGPSKQKSELGTNIPKHRFQKDSSTESSIDGSPQVITVQAMIHNDCDGTNLPITNETVLPRENVVRPVPILGGITADEITEWVQSQSDVVAAPVTVVDQVNVPPDVTVPNQIRPHDLPPEQANDRREIELEVERRRNEGPQLPTYLIGTGRTLQDATSYLGPLNRMCPHCSALHFLPERTTRNTFPKCCQLGNVVLEALGPMPVLLKQLFENRHPLSNSFKRLILRYNYAFQFVSIQANLRDLPEGRAPPVYVVHGKVYFNCSDVNVNEPAQRYGSVYFLDPEIATEQRQQNVPQLDRDLIIRLEELMRQVNPFALSYMHLRERYDHEVQTIQRLRDEAVRNNQEPLPLRMPTVTLELLRVRGVNARQYDLPLIDEVAIVYNIRPDAPATPNMRIYIRDHPTRFRELNEMNELLDPLAFPLLFPRGEVGWRLNIPHTRGGGHVTLCEHAAYRLAIRDNEPRFKHGAKLTQQYVVASYIKVENNRIRYILENQDRLRAAEYVGLADYLYNLLEDDDQENEERLRAISRMVILPSNYIGSPRQMQQLFQDAMAIVTRFGFPSLFITMTTNTNWSEITENIPPGHSASDHPSLTDRVFHCKLDELMKELLDAHIFGVPLANVYVIEFQKRGLPHCHSLLILRNDDKLNTALKIDALISAEIPDPETEPELYEIVTKFLIHGPCGEINPSSPCMVDGKCSKQYPKAFKDRTLITESGRVEYRRLNNGRTHTVKLRGRDFAVDNRWVVPYNPYLLLKYKCHINVEACATVHSVKYLYKYLFKGVDMALLRINRQDGQEYNEVEAYLNARYMSPPEAAWHLNQFEMHKNTHSVIRLPVHLPDRHVVTFRPGFEVQAVERVQRTHLTSWFALNQADPDARQYLYTEIPLHYVWNARTKRWTRRQRGADRIVVRMYSVNVRRQELLYLRILLLHVRGARSFEDIRTVDGVVCETFKEACRQRRLLADDTEWRRTLREASLRSMPRQMRSMFAYMLIFCNVSDPPGLWNEFLRYFIEDFTRRGSSEVEAIQRSLRHIQSILTAHGTRLSNYRLPEPDEEQQMDVVDVPVARNEAEQMFENLNPEQRTICDAVLAAIDDPEDSNRLFLVDAPAGSGKTYLFQTIITKLLSQERTAIVTSPTGIAASILKGGRTIHSFFRLPLDINETTTSSLTRHMSDGHKLMEASLLIIDEVSMVTNLIFNIIEKTLRDFANHDRPFGNKVVLLGGDFRQTLPVVTAGDRSDIVQACVKNSRHWQLFRRYPLQTNMRAVENEDFSAWLLQLGNNTLIPLRRSPYGNTVQIPAQCYVDDKQELIDFCFADMDPRVAILRCILAPTNAICDEINERVLNRLDGESKTYLSADSVDTDDDDAAAMANYPTEFLNSLTPSGLPPHDLTIKVGAVVMLLRNLNVRDGLCNGTRLIVRLLAENYIDAEKVDFSGTPTGERLFIPRIDLKTTIQTLPFTLRRRQFPIKLAYGLTVHKAQGQTFGRIGLHLEDPVFTHGQLYVAFSRVRRPEDVKVYLKPSSEQGKLVPESDNVYTKNVVFNEIL